jgi:hypothetical protein
MPKKPGRATSVCSLIAPSRRQFLKDATAVAAGMMTSTVARGDASALLPAINLGEHQVTRFVVGSNPVYGYSHFNHQYDQHMLEWFTDDRIVKLLTDCEKAGINTWQASYSHSMDRQFPKIRGAGCRIQWICLAASWHFDESLPRTPDALIDGVVRCAEAAARHKPIAIAHHGWATDMLWREGKIDMIKTFIDKVHDLGCAAGISTHNPVILEALEEKGWSNDFYMASMHYLSRRPEEWKKEIGALPVGEVYISTDPPKMCASVRKVKKPCLVYKVLAAGRKCGSPKEVHESLEFAYKNIKPKDAAIVGLYPRYSDQITEDTRMVREILA